MSLQGMKSPVYMANYDDKSLIISSFDRLGRYPVCKFSRPEWLIDISKATGVCVDDTGLQYTLCLYSVIIRGDTPVYIVTKIIIFIILKEKGKSLQY